MKDNYILQEIERLEGYIKAVENDAYSSNSLVNSREQLKELKLIQAQCELTAKLIVEGLKK